MLAHRGFEYISQEVSFDNIFRRLEEQYIKISTLTTTQGKVYYYYLGMVLDFIIKIKVRVTMTNNFQRVLY